jgi:thiamine-monophosphate kinase
VFKNETEFVRWLSGVLPMPTGRVRLGIGDDAALVRVGHGRELILTTDLSIEGVHFLRGLHPPDSVGHRALARSLSDIAAMGGVPRFALVSLVISRPTTRSWAERFYAGLRALAARFGVAVIGGDTALVRGATMVDVMVAGEVPQGRALRRSGARPGEQIFVSGRLGVSELGLRLLRRRGRRLHGAGADAVQAHLYPEPKCALGRFLSQERLASAVIDVSDGLSTDLGHLCEASGVGARIWTNLVPVPDVPLEAEVHEVDSLELALHGGEDYQLLFTVPSRNVSRIPRRFRGVPLQRIGEVQRSGELLLVRPNGEREPLRPGGYDHFRKAIR